MPQDRDLGPAMKAQSLAGKVTEIIHVVKTKAKNQDSRADAAYYTILLLLFIC